MPAQIMPQPSYTQCRGAYDPDWDIQLGLQLNVSRDKLLQQHLCLLQVERVEPLRKPPVNRSKQFARLLHLALVTPDARETHGGAEFPGFGLLLTSDREGALEIRLSFRHIRFGRHQCDFAGCSTYIGFPQLFP